MRVSIEDAELYLDVEGAELADEAELVFVDLRGQGRSARPPVESCTLEQMADDVAALVIAWASNIRSSSGTPPLPDAGHFGFSETPEPFLHAVRAHTSPTPRHPPPPQSTTRESPPDGTRGA